MVCVLKKNIGKSLSTTLLNNGSTYRILAVDKAENITDYTVTLKSISILEDEIDKSKESSKDENIIDNIKNSILKIDIILESEYMDLTSREKNQLRIKRKQLFDEFKQLCSSESIIVKSERGVPDLRMDSKSEGVLKSLFTDEDANQILYGNGVKIALEVSPKNKYKNIIPIEKSIPSERRIGYYMDISLTKYTEYQNERSESVRIGSIDDDILITVDIPKNLLSPENNRNFSLYKLHVGEVSTLNDVDGCFATITIKTNKFSTFAISYFDENPSWGSNMLMIIMLILIVSIIIFVEIRFLKNKNKIK